MPLEEQDERDDRLQLEHLRQELQARQYHRDPLKMADVIHDLVARRGYLQSMSADELATAWCSVVGKETAQHTRTGNVRRGILEIFVADSSLVQELTFQKRQVLKKLQDAAPNFKVRDIKFRVGGFS